MKLIKRLTKVSNLFSFLIIGFFVIAGCGKKAATSQTIQFSSEEEKISFAKKSEFERFKELGIRRVEIYQNENLSVDTSSGKPIMVRIYNENGIMISEVKFMDQDTTITLYKWNEFNKPSAVYLYDHFKNLKEKNLYYYDSKGNLIEENLNGQIEYFTNLYDKQNRLLQVIPSRYNNDQIVTSLSYNYNEDGSKLERTNGGFAYSSVGDRTTAEYDKNGLIMTRYWYGNSPGRLYYSYNSYGQLEKVVEQYDSNPELNTEKLHTYDSELNLVTIINKDANGVPVKKTSYIYKKQ